MFKGVASRALGVFALFTVVCGLGYTLVVTGIAQVAFPYQANGSLIKVDDKIVGSELIGQNFEDEDHMWGRIQNVTIVEGEDGGLMAYGTPSNLSPASEEYRQLIDARVKKIRAANPDADMDAVPVDLVTCSGSGLDPEISPDAAEYQVPRLAKATGKSEDEVRDIIAACTKGRFLGVFGEPTVNVLKVNLMLDGAL
ncbi:MULTISPECIES: potassium-transporting ATPase subunit KdpC [Collinsella]|uniref:potassium-transporting ATPase subunit KdpC n=1 Tax=Collinsella TaxID=102106 RepID=UPI001C21D4F8|nr:MULTISPECIES: potassium-transporting ATPase subunit KdpC [Collinsella]MBU8999634.1 potassium-transporting ATPase subunit KdpC [Collinsella aerofaciens]MBU9062220.1 potassium-transporting ATPase subunit KdpC [Collinsella sp. MSK.8.10]MCB5365890.1 potassium-transporting ATPase subunit KdpC [Collinsella aerofaciens]MCB5367317.1 potassium-transporting ATPase subunit KdpC [Collinsella aerofaciens]